MKSDRKTEGVLRRLERAKVERDEALKLLSEAYSFLANEIDWNPAGRLPLAEKIDRTLAKLKR